jgi:hypothetical protein
MELEVYPDQAEIVPAITAGDRVDFSIVIPMFNEEENERLYAEIKPVLTIQTGPVKSSWSMMAHG